MKSQAAEMESVEASQRPEGIEATTTIARTITLGPTSEVDHYRSYWKLLTLNPDFVSALWGLRPSAPQHVKIYDNLTEIPRRQLAMGNDYSFSGQTSRAVEWHPLILSVRDVLSELTGASFNGALLNFYEGPSEHIGPHSDDERSLLAGAPIAVASFGVPRRFRFTAKKGICSGEATAAQAEIIVSNGDIVVMRGDTQKTHKHEVRKPLKRSSTAEAYHGRRLSITMRAFR